MKDDDTSGSAVLSDSQILETAFFFELKDSEGSAETLVFASSEPISEAFITCRAHAA